LYSFNFLHAKILGPQRFAVRTEWLVTCSAGGMRRQQRAGRPAACKCSNSTAAQQHPLNHLSSAIAIAQLRSSAQFCLRDREQATGLTKRGGLGCTVSGLAHISSSEQAPTSTPPPQVRTPAVACYALSTLLCAACHASSSTPHSPSAANTSSPPPLGAPATGSAHDIHTRRSTSHDRAASDTTFAVVAAFVVCLFEARFYRCSRSSPNHLPSPINTLPAPTHDGRRSPSEFPTEPSQRLEPY